MNEMNSDERNELTEKILAAARRPCPEIVQRFNLRNKRTGAKITPGDFTPPEDVEPCDPYFVYMDRDGSTFGQRQPSEAILRARWEEHQDRDAAEFRSQLEEMSLARFRSQVHYWITLKEARR